MHRKAVVVGAGPAGSLAAICLARAGFVVQVFEKRPKPSPEPDGRSYALVVSARGLKALSGAGVDTDRLSKNTRPIEFAMYTQKGKVEQSVALPVETNVMVQRNELGFVLVEEAKRLYPDSITFCFEHPFLGAELAARQVTFDDKRSNTTVQVCYDLLVAADGAHSAVREVLSAQVPNFTFRKETHGVMVKTFPVTQADLGSLADKPCFFHQYPLADARLFLGGRDDDMYSAAFTMHSDDIEAYRRKPKDQQRLSLPEGLIPPGVEKALQTAVADMDSKFMPLSPWVTCSQLIGPQVVIMGDAAHSVTPVLGQGANSSLEDCTVLAAALQEQPDDIQAALELYNKRRLPDAHALVAVNKIISNVRGMQPPTPSQALLKLQISLLAWHVMLHTVLHRVASPVFDSGALMRMIAGTSSYSDTFQAIKYDGLLLLGGLAAVAAAATLKLV